MSSPPTWGCFRRTSRNIRFQRVFPTSVGYSHYSFLLKSLLEVFLQKASPFSITNSPSPPINAPALLYPDCRAVPGSINILGHRHHRNPTSSTASHPSSLPLLRPFPFRKNPGVAAKPKALHAFRHVGSDSEFSAPYVTRAEDREARPALAGAPCRNIRFCAPKPPCSTHIRTELPVLQTQGNKKGRSP